MYFTKTKIFWGIFGIFVFLFLFTPRPADAFVWWPIIVLGSLATDYLFGSPILSALAQPVLDAFSAFINVFLGTIAFVLQGIYIGMAKVLVDLLQHLLSVSVIPDPDKIPFVYDAWNFSRGFVNGLFLLILVFIGLATILRWQSYQMQRTLFILILMALLVNFSGVFVGFVVDMGNLLAGYFLNLSTNASFEWNPWGGLAPYQTAEKMGQNIARIIFYLLSIVIYFSLFLLFGVRIIVLWTISILAPFAFAAFILPATRKWGQQWLSALIQWALLGVPISFFVYLSGRAITADYTGTGLDNAIVAIFAPASAILLLVVGISFSLSLAPTWGRRIALLGGVAGLGAGAGLAYLGIRRYGKDTQQFFANMRQRAQGIPLLEEKKTRIEKWLGKAGKLPGFKQAGSALSRWGKREVVTEEGQWREVSRVQPDGTVTRERVQIRPPSMETRRGGVAGRLFGAGGKIAAFGAGAFETGAQTLNTLANKSAKETLAKAMRQAQQLRPEANAIEIRKAAARPAKDSSMVMLAHYLKMVIDDDPSDIESLVASGSLSQDHLKKIGKAAKQLEDPTHYRTFLKSQINRISDFEPNWGENDINRFIHRFVRPEDISNINIDWHQYDPTDEQKKKTLDRLVIQMARNPLPAMLQAVGDPKARERILRHLESHDDDWFVENNKENVLLWSTSNTALDQFGLAPIRGYTREQAQRIVREKKFKKRSTESLEQEFENVQKELLIDRGPQQKRNLLQQASRIEEELEIRDLDATGPGSLEEEATTLTTILTQLEAKPEDRRGSSWHQAKAKAQRELQDVQAEQKRRQQEAPVGAAAQKGITIPPITESVGEQIANKTSRKRELDELLARPGPVANRSALQKERRTLVKELDQLATRKNQLPHELRQREDRLERIQRDYLNVQKKAGELQLAIEKDHALGKADEAIQLNLDRLKLAQDKLRELEYDRNAARQERTEHITRQRASLNPPAETLAEVVAAMKAHEWELTRQLRQQEATSASAETLQKTENLLAETQRSRQISERKLTAVLRGEEITNTINTLQNQLQNTPSFDRTRRRQVRIDIIRQQNELRRLQNMEGDWTNKSAIVKRGQIEQELKSIERTLLTNPPQAQRQALETRRDALQAEYQNTTGVADRDPNTLTPAEHQEVATYKRSMERLQRTKPMQRQITTLLGRYEATAKEVHAEARRKEEGGEGPTPPSGPRRPTPARPGGGGSRGAGGPTGGGNPPTPPPGGGGPSGGTPPTGGTPAIPTPPTPNAGGGAQQPPTPPGGGGNPPNPPNNPPPAGGTPSPQNPPAPNTSGGGAAAQPIQTPPAPIPQTPAPASAAGITPSPTQTLSGNPISEEEINQLEFLAMLPPETRTNTQLSDLKRLKNAADDMIDFLDTIPNKTQGQDELRWRLSRLKAAARGEITAEARNSRLQEILHARGEAVAQPIQTPPTPVPQTPAPAGLEDWAESFLRPRPTQTLQEGIEKEPKQPARRTGRLSRKERSTAIRERLKRGHRVVVARKQEILREAQAYKKTRRQGGRLEKIRQALSASIRGGKTQTPPTPQAHPQPSNPPQSESELTRLFQGRAQKILSENDQKKYVDLMWEKVQANQKIPAYGVQDTLGLKIRWAAKEGGIKERDDIERIVADHFRQTPPAEDVIQEEIEPRFGGAGAAATPPTNTPTASTPQPPLTPNIGATAAGEPTPEEKDLFDYEKRYLRELEQTLAKDRLNMARYEQEIKEIEDFGQRNGYPLYLTEAARMREVLQKARAERDHEFEKGIEKARRGEQTEGRGPEVTPPI